MKIYQILAFSVLIILISGATGCQTGSKESTSGPFVGGFTGLTAAFVEDAPPASGLFQGESFPIEIELTNKGETSVKAGDVKVNLVGTVTGGSFDLTTKSASNEGEIYPIDISGGEGGYEVVSLGNAKYKPLLSASYSPNVIAQVCYPYRTKIQLDNFCIPSDDRNPVGKGECETDSKTNLVKSGANSAGPIQVTSFTESKGVGYVKVRVDINNQGGGDVINCGTNERDFVTVNLPQDVSCNFEGGKGSSGIAKLREGHAVLNCEKKTSNQGLAYLDKFDMTLAYDYMQQITKTVTINKAD